MFKPSDAKAFVTRHLAVHNYLYFIVYLMYPHHFIQACMQVCKCISLWYTHVICCNYGPHYIYCPV